MGTKITDHYFEYNEKNYFRGGAEDVVIGSYGKKRDPIGPNSHLEVQTEVKSDYLVTRVEYVMTIPVDWSAAANANLALSIGLDFLGLDGSLAGAANIGAAAKQSLQLCKFLVEKAKLEVMLNNDAVNARNFLADNGDGRICSAVWVGVDDQLGEHFSSYGLNGSFSVNGNSDLTFTATGGKSGAQSISLSAKGHTFAYLLEKVTNWSDSKTHVDEMKEDYHS